MKSYITERINEVQLMVQSMLSDAVLLDTLEQAAVACIRCFRDGGKILLAGNGGSAADAQHIAAEFTGRFVKERRALPALALTTDTSALTAIGNDFGFDKIFERQIEALALPGDVLIAISTSGNSENVINAIKKANEMECLTIGLTGKGGGMMKELCNINIVIPSSNTARQLTSIEFVPASLKKWLDTPGCGRLL